MSGPIEVMKKSSNSVEKVPSKGKWRNLAAAARASVGVLPGAGLAPLLVPSQRWVPPEGVVTFWGPDRMGPS